MFFEKNQRLVHFINFKGGVGAVAMNGKIFAIGGDSDKGKLNTIEIFDPVTNKWTAGGAALKDPRFLCCFAAKIYDFIMNGKLKIN